MPLGSVKAKLFRARDLLMQILKITKMITDLKIIEKYFPNLTDNQKEQFQQLKPLYEKWNSQINVISRKILISYMNDTFYILYL